jgi:FkbM family methyltransferase
MEPMLVSTPPQAVETGNLLKRGLTTVVVHRRLPYRVATWKDRLLKRVGSKYRQVRVDGLEFGVRRGTWADESIIRHVVTEAEYTPPGYQIGPDDTVIDVGANIGAFSVLAARAATNGWVISYEPEPDNAALLRRNLDRNQCRNVTVVSAAVAGQRGVLTLHLNPDNSGGHSVRRDHGGPSLSVPTVTLRDVFDEHRVSRCDFLKIDCEGAEYDILYSLPRQYFARVRRIVMEYHGDPATKREQADGLVHHLQYVGFRIDRYTDVIGSRGGLLYATREDDSEIWSGRT